VETCRREDIQRSLRNLAESYAALMRLLEKTLAMLCEEAAFDPPNYSQTRQQAEQPSAKKSLVIDAETLFIYFRGKKCFLGGRLPFKLLARLARRPSTYVTYEQLCADVWNYECSDDAVRSMVKLLRRKLRAKGLGELADAIDGSVPRRYALHLDKNR
jgi:DNA-binding response OmpR family regulator